MIDEIILTVRVKGSIRTVHGLCNLYFQVFVDLSQRRFESILEALIYSCAKARL